MAESSPKQYNMRNPAVKRILQEVKEMHREGSKDYVSMPLEDDIFEWQFAIHGPKETEFEGGIYHGRITLPAEYPFKPPSFMLLTPSGRFQTQTKICLSISNYHPEHWQPSWSVRTALVALIAFMPTKADGALGSLDFPKEKRRLLALKSRANPPKFGSEERQRIIRQLHEEMLKTAPSIPEGHLSLSDVGESQAEEGEPPAQSPEAAGLAKGVQTGEDSKTEEKSLPPAGAEISSLGSRNDEAVSPREEEPAADSGEISGESEAGNRQDDASLGNNLARVDAGSEKTSGLTGQQSMQAETKMNREETGRARGTESSRRGGRVGDWVEQSLNFLAVAIFVAILALLARKFLVPTKD